MKTEIELCTKNDQISEQILEIHPGLSQLLDEMPITFPDKISYDIYLKSISDYLDRLNTYWSKIPESQLKSNSQCRFRLLNSH